MGANGTRLERQPDTREIPRAQCLEGRFARLAGEGWRELPAPIRHRFSRKLADGERIVYVGAVAHTTIHWLGRVFAELGRLIGAPLPLDSGQRMAATVIVSGCERMGGQVWTRIYERSGAFPQVIQSVKTFAGTTGLQEIVAHGVGMRLTLEVENRALVFHSAGYFLRIAGIEVSLPSWLMPGAIEVIHREESAGEFSFRLIVTHGLVGRIIDQIAFFREENPI